MKTIMRSVLVALALSVLQGCPVGPTGHRKAADPPDGTVADSGGDADAVEVDVGLKPDADVGPDGDVGSPHSSTARACADGICLTGGTMAWTTGRHGSGRVLGGRSANARFTLEGNLNTPAQPEGAN